MAQRGHGRRPASRGQQQPGVTQLAAMRSHGRKEHGVTLGKCWQLLRRRDVLAQLSGAATY